ncbi:DNA glycosylase [Hypoxylon sp. NC1633]|nr:DNA glycosylase [Hypoxylon sp. NC1633]
MDWMRRLYLAEMGNPSHSNKLANDYTFGFDVGDDFHQWYLGTTIVNGWAPREDIKYFTRLSLLRGFEQWEQMLCCANSMREKASFDNPLDGQDILTFLTEILYPPVVFSHESSKKQTSKLREKVKDATETVHPVHSGTIEQASKKRKKVEMNGKAIPEQTTKKHRKGAESPFWPAPASQPLEQSVHDGERLRKARGEARRKEEWGRIPEEAHDVGYHAVLAPAQGPVLREANVINRRDHITFMSKQIPDDDDQESVSGSDILRSRPPPHAVTDTDIEAKESLKDSQAKLCWDTSEKHTTALLRRDDKSSPSQAPAHALTPKRKAKSPYFVIDPPSPLEAKSPRPLRGTVPCIPFPCLNAPKFGLIQEDLAADPFRLLIAVTFLRRVKGKQAIPVFYKLMSKYPTPRDLAEADTNDIVAMIKHLGLAVVRATAIQTYARIWIKTPPRAGVRHSVKNYPKASDGIEIRGGEALGMENPRPSEWEIGHMTQGRYAIDSWRIFCRDVLLGRAEDWRGRGREGEFQPEWMRVHPEDKELRACLRWLWMQEGWAWDPRTGERDVLSEDLRKAVEEGRVTYDDAGELKILG